jgi:DNA-binding NarL/FixJ family response regulator
LPEALAAVLEAAALTGTPAIWRQRNLGETLEVSFLPLTGHFGDARWMLRFEEHSDALAVPEHWRLRLTEREQQVTSGVLQGWDNRLIGAELGCAEGTVKRHLQSIFEKLGVDSRTVLVVRAAQKARA